MSRMKDNHRGINAGIGTLCQAEHGNFARPDGKLSGHTAERRTVTFYENNRLTDFLVLTGISYRLIVAYLRLTPPVKPRLGCRGGPGSREGAAGAAPRASTSDPRPRQGPRTHHVAPSEGPALLPVPRQRELDGGERDEELGAAVAVPATQGPAAGGCFPVILPGRAVGVGHPARQVDEVAGPGPRRQVLHLDVREREGLGRRLDGAAALDVRVGDDRGVVLGERCRAALAVALPGPAVGVEEVRQAVEGGGHHARREAEAVRRGIRDG
ncbi:hypothetical protein THAOC_03004 [Thalassiosira oceanica]|uniref:Uncharacterized protein n=1 Tax=Thalassiosira oceanica TaxID=159749 RepID=K0TCY2_THAOC|nr:hypothetical protein THAOC_03004 [Thalassiosira oceanica]|eukprot:EJK75275.1 hypothetical protein THAOC_03004 [Thalassiosira oceanica]